MNAGQEKGRQAFFQIQSVSYFLPEEIRMKKLTRRNGNDESNR